MAAKLPKCLERIATQDLPPPFGDKLRTILTTVGEIKEEAAKLGINRNFTPDGRFIGDFGEVIAKLRFGVILHDVQTEGEDGTCQISGKTVEVKIRSKSSLVWVKKKPDILLALYLSPETLKWGVVCNGPGEALLEDAKWSGEHKRFETTLSKLLKAQARLASGSACLSESVTPVILGNK